MEISNKSQSSLFLNGLKNVFHCDLYFMSKQDNGGISFYFASTIEKVKLIQAAVDKLMKTIS